MGKTVKQIYDVEVLRGAMVQQFLNYQQIAEKTGLKYHAIYRIFNCTRKNRIRKPELIERIALTLKVPLITLFKD
ncbi:MAG: hypothetical protein HZA78_04775 [Candidatus Schekmanbacteria bacterium]|nr:hypothetical protein [Candidatus Schekmanbacteria bacterium]